MEFCCLKEIIENSQKGDEFDDIRKIRNSVNYYGKHISVQESIEIIKKIKTLRIFVYDLLIKEGRSNRMNKIKIISGNIEAIVELKHVKTSKAIYEKLPIEGTANRWGDEIYFEIPVSLELEDDAREDVEKGDLGYWVQGKCFCIFFGKTPASTNDKPRAASKVNVFGKVVGDYNIFKKVNDGDKIVITKHNN